MRWALALVVTAWSGCSSDTGPHALFDLRQLGRAVAAPTADNDFYRIPFPNDLRTGSDGTVDLGTYPPQLGQLAEYISAVDDLERGYGLSAGMFFRFDAAVDPASLPGDYAASLAPEASAFVVDITAGSPTFGQRTPVRSRFTALNYDFIGPNWVALLPLPGLPLREQTTYAAIVTDGLRGAGGQHVARSTDFDAVVRGQLALPAYAPLLAWMQAHPDVAPHVVDAAVFTTCNATSVMQALRAAVYAEVPPPSLDGLTYVREETAGVDYLYEATYQGPNFQAGDPSTSGDIPYRDRGGNIVFDDAGVPEVQRMERLRVAITVPEGPMPAAGWPVIIYQHGTGGDYMSFVQDGSGRQAALVSDRSGAVIAKMAMIGTDQVLHGTRVPPGVNYDLAFFNLFNLRAARDNPKQGALDGFQVVRLLHAIDVVAAPTTGQPIKFDTSRIYFKGHSQGGLTGALFLAAEPEVKAAVLSGAGGGLINSLLDKTQPYDIPQLVQSFFHDPIDEFHPMLNLVQGYFEEADPLSYARRLFAEPLPGVPPKHVFQTMGLIDHYTPVPSIKALALAAGVQPAGPELEPIDGLAFTTTKWGQPPIASNVAGGQVTGVLLEYTAPAGHDGHFVVFDVPAAIAQSNRFLATHAATGTARLDLP